MEAKEEKRQEYLELIKDIPKDKLVFIVRSVENPLLADIHLWLDF